MKQFTLQTLRKKFLDFYTSKDHKQIPSAPLVPENDPTTLFTSSGMQPLVPNLLGEPHPKGVRLVDSQKCFRAVDIDDVGDNRHTTFFEMLGNWSLGDYFKKEQLTWIFEFLTAEVGLDPAKLFVTVFEGDATLEIERDDESVTIWQELFKGVGIEAKAVSDAETKGMQGGRIFYYGKDNWWSRAGEPAKMPAGEPGGPDSEIFYDFGAGHMIHEESEWKDKPCHINCDCGRYMEICNSVFIQYLKQDDGSFALLKQKNVDFGGGLERILAASLDQPDVFKTPAFTQIIEQLEKISGQKYQDETVKVSFRVIADHVRAAFMLAGDGVYPANKEQGYFSRRLLRRAVRFGKMIGVQQAFIADLVPLLVQMYQDQYPYLVESEDKIKMIFAQEEKKFEKALVKGMREIEKLEKLDGELAFKLYETYGFPFELTQEIAQERGHKISQEDFDSARKSHADKSRTASAGKFKGGLADQSNNTLKYHTATHLLHAALRQVLGDHVSQKGSNITASRLRFDFNFEKALTATEKQEVEKLINAWIDANLPMTRQELPKQEALDSGATAFFIEKYPDIVSVYTIGKNPAGKQGDLENGWISKEFCGGPHVENTSEIGTIKLTKEQSAGAGIRRIYMELV